MSDSAVLGPGLAAAMGRLIEQAREWHKTGEVTRDLEEALLALGLAQRRAGQIEPTDSFRALAALATDLIPRPAYDVGSRELSWHGTRVRVLRRAGWQAVLLEAFEEAGWKRSLPDPLPSGCGNRKARLRRAVAALNEGIEPNTIRFGVDSVGGWVYWYRVDD